MLIYHQYTDTCRSPLSGLRASRAARRLAWGLLGKVGLTFAMRQADGSRLVKTKSGKYFRIANERAITFLYKAPAPKVWTLDPKHVEARTIEPKPHKKLEPEEGQLVIEIMRAHKLTLPTNAIEWRVPRTADGQPLKGSHSVFEGTITVLLTDGVLAWCAIGLVEPGCPVFLGHLANLELDKPERETRPLTPRQQKLNSLANED